MVSRIRQPTYINSLISKTSNIVNFCTIILVTGLLENFIESMINQILIGSIIDKNSSQIHIPIQS